MDWCCYILEIAPRLIRSFIFFCIVLICELVFSSANSDSEILSMIDNLEGSFSEILFVYYNYLILWPILGWFFVSFIIELELLRLLTFEENTQLIAIK